MRRLRGVSSLPALALCLGLAPGGAAAGVFTHVDPVSGMIVMSNVARAGTSRPAAQVGAPAPRLRPGAAPDFPRISAQRQRSLDGERRAILEDELRQEQRALAAASSTRAAGEVRARHAANVAALQRELGALAGNPHHSP